MSTTPQTAIRGRPRRPPSPTLTDICNQILKKSKENEIVYPNDRQRKLAEKAMARAEATDFVVDPAHGMILDFPALKSMAKFAFQEEKLPSEPLHIYKPTLNMSLSAQYTAIDQVAYSLCVENPADRILTNLTVSVAFQRLPFFLTNPFNEEKESEGIVVARAHIPVLHAKSSSNTVLTLKEPIFPPFLVTFASSRGIPGPDSSPAVMKNFIENVMKELSTNKTDFMKLMKIQHSCLITQLDLLITPDIYRNLMRTLSGPPTVLSMEKSRYGAVASIPFSVGIALWPSGRLSDVCESIAPFIKRNESSISYVLVKGVFVEVKIAVSNEPGFIKVNVLTPNKRITSLMRQQIQMKFNSLCILGNMKKRCMLKPLDLTEEEEMISKQTYDFENRMKFVTLAIEAESSSDEEEEETGSEDEETELEKELVLLDEEECASSEESESKTEEEYESDDEECESGEEEEYEEEDAVSI